MQSGTVIIILSLSFVVFFCLLYLFACVVLPHYVVNKDEYIYIYIAQSSRCGAAFALHQSLHPVWSGNSRMEDVKKFILGSRTQLRKFDTCNWCTVIELRGQKVIKSHRAEA